MINVRIGECDFDIIPIIKGLVSEKEKVLDALNSNEYDAAAVALGPEDVEAITRRAEIEGVYEPSELDSVYSYILMNFGAIDMPDPASTILIDECKSRNIPVIPLDMCEEEFTNLYCETISTMEFLKERRIAKKAMKKKFNKTNPETFIMEWDALMNKMKGYKKMSKFKEEYIANQMKETAKYRKHVLAVIELERINGIKSLL